MSAPWVSPLVSLPADGATVFVRRLRFFDTPVLATWDLASGLFSTIPIVSLTVVAGTFAGTWALTYGTNWGGVGTLGWMVEASPGIFIGAQNIGPNWYLVESDLIANAYNSASYLAPFAPHVALSFTTAGAPSWSPPTALSISQTSPLVSIPAWGINSWRSQ